MALVQTRKAISVREPAPRLPTNFWLLMAGFGVVRAGGCVMLFLSFYLSDHLQYSASLSGLVASLFGTGWIVGLMIAGWSIDRFGRKFTLVFSLMSASISYMVLGYAPNQSVVMAAAFFAGMFFDVNRTVVTTVITDILPESQRKNGFGYQYLIVNVATGISAIAGGLLAMHSYILIFWFNSIMSMIFLAFMLIFISLDDKPIHKKHQQESTIGKGYGIVVADRLFLALFISSLLFFLVFSQFVFTMPIIMNEDGLSPVAFGMVCLVIGSSVLIMQPLLKKWVMARYRPTSIATVGCLVMGLGMTATALSSTPISYIMSSWLWLPGEIIFVVSVQFIVSSIAPPGALGRYNGIWGTSSGIAALIAPVLGTFVLDFAGKQGLALICAITGILGAVIFMATSSRMHRRSPSLTEAGIR